MLLREKDEFDEMADAKPTLSDSGKKLRPSLILNPRKRSLLGIPGAMRTRGISRTEDQTKRKKSPREKASSRAATKKPAKYQLDESLIRTLWTPNLSRRKGESTTDSRLVQPTSLRSPRGVSEKDEEFDIQDGESLAKKIASKEKPKKAPPKKLTTDLGTHDGRQRRSHQSSRTQGTCEKLPVPEARGEAQEV